MENLRMLLKKTIDEKLPEEHKDLGYRLVEAACAALDEGADADRIDDVVAAEVGESLAEAESTLSEAERIIRGGAL